ncbi:MAG: hypothetical protein IH886_02565 [Nitrospinae bacterium]|nr:hypothetical protein [Nitrospinota bacterium]
MSTQGGTLPDCIRNRFIDGEIGFGDNDIVQKMVRKQLLSVNSKYLGEFGISYENILETILDSGKMTFPAGIKRGQIFDCISHLGRHSEWSPLSARIIGNFVDDPIQCGQVDLFEKQASFVLKNADTCTKALLLGTITLGLLSTNNRLNKQIRLQRPPISQFTRWFDIRDSEDELWEIFKVIGRKDRSKPFRSLANNYQKVKTETPLSVAVLEDNAGGAQ